ncbi:S41 family peptidase [Rubellicoccus peritrichatus]|uniref:S41 family peptidase n=1 Tax=Rubellicoccus peritrichatus TaxID=3080537 RepID=A0AAQ3L7A7_9BACT|nr:S41 family peptidase [Puniceicoccus sp. CR14]WOO39957.1 S41 family peptidase [Puniceicoccus sp. CR14]
MKIFFRYVLIILVAVLIARFTVLWVLRPSERAWLSPTYWETMGKVGHVMRIVNAYYVDADKADFDTLSLDALNQMLGGLDRYSDYLDSDEFSDFEVTADQRYAGIGVEIERLNRRITVSDVFEGSPAEEVGFLEGDQIVAVGEEDMREAGLEEIVELLRGPEGSTTALTLFRPATNESFELEVERRHIEYPTVRDIELTKDAIGYFRLSQFSRRSAEEVAQALDDLEARGMKGLILDMRNNPGGTLPASIAIAGEFLEPDTVVISTRGRSESDVSYELTGEGAANRTFPVVILINDFSASASEIVSGALQDLKRAIIVGEESVGKGSVQSIIYLADQEAVRLTTARYYLPSGRTIHEVGVKPDIEVPVTAEERLRLFGQRAFRDLTDDEFKERFGVMRTPDVQRDVAEDVLRGIFAFENRKGS